MPVWVSVNMGECEHASIGECEYADVNEREEHAKERSHAPKVWSVCLPGKHPCSWAHWCQPGAQGHG